MFLLNFGSLPTTRAATHPLIKCGSEKKETMILYFNFAASIAKIQFTNFKRKISLNKFYLQIGKQLFGLLLLNVFLLKLKNKLQYACGHFSSRQSPEQTLLILLIIETILHPLRNKRNRFSFFSFLNPIFSPEDI